MQHFIWPPNQCCSSTAENIQKILIDGIEVGIYKLNETFKEVKKLVLDEDALKKEILRRIRVNNYVPKNKENEYLKAIFDAYKDFIKNDSS